jgi:hypothetical protein
MLVDFGPSCATASTFSITSTFSIFNNAHNWHFPYFSLHQLFLIVVISMNG